MNIAVAMSGGVDSSVTAAILQQEGHSITGYTMRHYHPEEMNYPSQFSITKAIEDAKKVCDKLNIEHKVIHVEDEFKKIVVQNFLDEYKKGRTPNPCTLCNPTIKWGTFLQEIEKDGSEKVATGHYVNLAEKSGIYHLYRGEDKKRDQSYMLWRLSQNQLSKTLFPLAAYSKNETRKLANYYCLPTAEKSDSQEICFIYGHYKEFLKGKIDYKEGPIVFAPSGEKIGVHQGLPFYTIGQRKGLNTPWKSALYVLKSDVRNNILDVTDDISELMKDEFEIEHINWIREEIPSCMADVTVQIRYNSPAVQVKCIKIQNDKAHIILEKPVKAITSGQSAVFYYGNELIGGGIIL
jgi:tRNA-specific 2-thiouridylase